MPSVQVGEPVHVLVELPAEPRFADAADPDDRHEMRAPLFDGNVEKILDDPKLTVSADEGSFQALRLQRSRDAGDDPKRAPQLNRFRFAFELPGAGVFVRDRDLGDAPRRFADVHLSGLGGGLDARRGVHHVSGDHAFTGRAEVDGRFAGEHAGARAKAGGPNLFPESRDGLGEVDRRTDGPLGVVFHRHRRAPHGHDCVSDELLHHTAVARDDRPARVEVSRQQVADFFRVARLRERGEADQVGEEDGNQPPFGPSRHLCRPAGRSVFCRALGTVQR